MPQYALLSEYFRVKNDPISAAKFLGLSGQYIDVRSLFGKTTLSERTLSGGLQGARLPPIRTLRPPAKILPLQNPLQKVVDVKPLGDPPPENCERRSYCFALYSNTPCTSPSHT